ncbi:hypothetical protein ACVNPX_00210 [Staphylococcus aureus]
MANIGYEGQYHVRIINQDIDTKDDDTSQNKTSDREMYKQDRR